MSNSPATTCPECREAIAPDARRCKHCGADVQAARRAEPRHGGTCPFCKEKIDPEAVICKHCGSNLLGAAAGPDHGGTCPFCRETIDPDAIVCPHCRSTLAADTRAVAFMNIGGDRYDHQTCVNFVYDACVARGGRSRVDCERIAERICTDAGHLIGGFGGAPYLGTDPGVVSMSSGPPLTQPIATANLGRASTSGCQGCTSPGSDRSWAPYVFRGIGGGKHCIRVYSCIAPGTIYEHCAWHTICVELTAEGQLEVSVD